ncbi:MAG TPA: hypothetical protein VN258_09345, partial [Mobilitalea sp.]|nr:hypothetical protein [Mobilitalea sp.]
AAFSKKGTLSKIAVTIGDKIEQGNVLAYLKDEGSEQKIDELTGRKKGLQADSDTDQTKLNYQLEIAALEYEKLKASYDILEGSLKKEKYIELVKKNNEILSLKLEVSHMQQQLDLKLSQIDEQLTEYQKEAEQNTLTAPCSGTVAYIAFDKIGKTIAADAPIIVIAKEDELYLQTEYIPDTIISEALEIYALIGSEKIQLTNIGYPQEEYISRKLSGKTLRSKFKLKDDSDLQNKKAGSYGSIFIKKKEVKDALIIPRIALLKDPTGSYVYVMTDGRQDKRAVTTGLAAGGLLEILSGLSEGEIVCLNTVDLLDSKDKDTSNAKQDKVAENEPEDGMEEVVKVVESGDYTEEFTATGLEYSYLESDVVTMEEDQAKFVKYSVREGTAVKKGDILMEYQLPYDELAMEESRLTYQREEDAYEAEKVKRAENLSKLREETDKLDPVTIDGKISKIRLTMEEDNYAKYCQDTQERLTQLKKNLDEMEERTKAQFLYAPLDGIVVSLQPYAGNNTITIGTPIMYIYNPDSRVLMINNPSGKLKYQMDVQIEAAMNTGGESLKYKGTIISADNILDDTLVNQYAMIQLEDKKAEINADISVLKTMIKSVESVPIVDANMFQANADINYAYVKKEDEISIRPVQVISNKNGQVAWVYHGLSIGETIYARKPKQDNTTKED